MNYLLYLPIIIPSLLILFSSIAVLFMDRDEGSYERALGLTYGTLVITLAVIIVSLSLGMYGPCSPVPYIWTFQVTY